MLELNSEKLIKNVEKFPCIWNDSIPEYQNTHTKDIAWNSVAIGLVDNWAEIKLEEKSFKLEAMKKRWGNIRDCYKKELYIQKNCGTERPWKKREKYIYTDKLEFLRTIIESKISTSNVQPNPQINNKNTSDMDSESLILSIQNFECLWDTNAKDYSDKNVKDSAWNSIAEELVNDWCQLTEDQQAAKLELLKKRWSNIKDSYKKELHIQKKYGPDWIRRKHPQYKHTEILSFLTPIYKRKDASINYYTEEVETGKLILKVKKYQCLWNVACEEYHNVYLKDIGWSKVSAGLITDWALLNEDQKSDIVYEFKKRWKNIRNSYKKELDTQKYGYQGKRKRKQRYKHMSKLKFLEPIYESKEYEYSLDDDVDSELLILAIEKFPCLWNIASKKYKNKILKEIAWNSVAEDLIYDWHEFDGKRKSTRIKELKKRWNNIKDSFKKEIDIQYKCGTSRPAKKRKQYKYTEILDFLRPIFEQKYNCESFYTDDHSCSLSEEYILDDDLLTPETTVTTHHEDEDSDLMFLKSLLPDMKSLSDSQKFEFKMEVMKTLQSFHMKGSGDSSNSSPSCVENKYKIDVQYEQPDSMGDVLEYN